MEYATLSSDHYFVHVPTIWPGPALPENPKVGDMLVGEEGYHIYTDRGWVKPERFYVVPLPPKKEMIGSLNRYFAATGKPLIESHVETSHLEKLWDEYKDHI